MKHYLNDVNPEHVFWVKDGSQIKNLKELYEKLEHMNNEDFQHHVNNEKNDFHSWIFHIIKDNELADRISKLKHKKAMSSAVKKRIKEIEKHICSEEAKAKTNGKGKTKKQIIIEAVAGLIIGIAIGLVLVRILFWSI